MGRPSLPDPVQHLEIMEGVWSVRVALLTWDMPPAPTGLGRAANEIARGLMERGADVTVFSADRSGVSEDSGLRIVGVTPSPFLARTRERACRGHLAMPTAFARAVVRGHTVEPFDVIETTNWYAPGALVGRLGLPLVVRCSTPAIDALDPDGDERHRRDMAFAHALERRLVLQADAAVYNTAPHLEHMRSAYDLPTEHEGAVIGLSLSADVVAQGAQASYPGSDEPTRYLFVGRAERRKGFDEMLAAFASLHDGAAELHLVGLSPGDLAERLTALGIGNDVAHAIHDHGRTDDETMAKLMEQTHVVLAPSRYESYGLVYREAAAWGRPCVMCAVDPSAADFVERVGSGVLARDCSGEAIAAAARDALAAAQRLRAAGLAHAATLTRAELGRRTLDVYERVVRQRSSADP